MPADPRDPDLLRSYLADRDAACPGCGYNLRNLTGGVCPECSAAITIGVSRADPLLKHRRLLLTAAIVTAMAAAGVFAQLAVSVWIYGVSGFASSAVMQAVWAASYSAAFVLSLAACVRLVRTPRASGAGAARATRSAVLLLWALVLWCLPSVYWFLVWLSQML